jgi:hypothetical protein
LCKLVLDSFDPFLILHNVFLSEASTICQEMIMNGKPENYKQGLNKFSENTNLGL